MTTYTKSFNENGIILTPAHPPKYAIIWLHGLGADGSDFLPVVPELHLPNHLPVRFIFPHAPFKPVTINNGNVMRAWYDIYSMSIDQRIDQQGINDSIKLLSQWIQHEESSGIPTQNILLAGFSQGAVVALTAGLRYPKPLGGLMGLSGYLPEPNALFANTSLANKSTPIFIGHGTEDTVVPFFLGEHAVEELRKHEYHVSAYSYPMGHSVCAKEVEDMSKWLGKVLEK